MNEQKQQEQLQKESFKIIFFMAGFYSFSALAIILMLLIFN
jgi:hypothetical protein